MTFDETIMKSRTLPGFFLFFSPLLFTEEVNESCIILPGPRSNPSRHIIP